MTGLDKIIKEIQKDAEQLAINQIQEAHEKTEEILAEVEVYKKEQAEKAAENAKLLRANSLERAQSSAELQRRKAILIKKQKIIAEIIEQAKTRMENLNDKDYFDILTKLATKYSSGEHALLKLNSRDLQKAPAEFKKSLPDCIEVSKETCDIKNGFILVYDGIDINCTFDSLFEEKNELLQDKVAQVLFK